MKLEERIREVLRFKHYSLRTEETYVGWPVFATLRRGVFCSEVAF